MCDYFPIFVKKANGMGNPPYYKPLQPSMKRRMNGYDYHGRRVIMFTLNVQDRLLLLGRLTGRYDAPLGSQDAPRVMPSDLGVRVLHEWKAIPAYEPKIRLIAVQLMPDHFHGIFFITETIEKRAGDIIGAFKSRCNRHFRQLLPEVAARMRELQQQDEKRGFLFEQNFNDEPLSGRGQLRRMIDYVHDNPLRLAMKRAHRDYFCQQMVLATAGLRFVAMGNRSLLSHPRVVAVHCRHRWTKEQTAACQRQLMELARGGAVLIGAFISEAERAVRDAAFAEGLPLIHLRANGFSAFEKPAGRWFDYCVRGLFLEMVPEGWPHVNGHVGVSRSQCVALNMMAEQIGDSWTTGPSNT